MTPLEVKAIRRELDMSQADLADVIGCHKMVVSRWERGEHEPARTAVVMLLALRMLHRRKMLRRFLAELPNKPAQAA